MVLCMQLSCCEDSTFEWPLERKERIWRFSYFTFSSEASDSSSMQQKRSALIPVKPSAGTLLIGAKLEFLKYFPFSLAQVHFQQWIHLDPIWLHCSIDDHFG